MLLYVFDLLKTLVEFVDEVRVVHMAFCRDFADKVFICLFFLVDRLYEEFTSVVAIVCCFLNFLLRLQLNCASLKTFRCN